MTQESPPGFVLYFPPPGHDVYPWAMDQENYEDARIFAQMPDSLKFELQSYYEGARRQTDEGVDPLKAWRYGQPCLWLDETTKRCKNYEHRPATCREFQPGEEACLEYRKRGGLS